MFNRNLNLWYTTDHWNQQSRIKKFSNYLFFVFTASLWVTVVMRICSDFHSLSIPRLSDGVSMCVGGFSTVSSMVLLALTREGLSEVLMEAEDKYLALIKRSESFSKKARWSYMIEFQLLTMATFGGIMLGVTQTAYMLVTGNLFYDTSLTGHTESYTLEWWLHMFYQGSVPVYSGIFYSLKEFLLMAPHYHLSLMFTHHAETVEGLWNGTNEDKDEDNEKLREVAKESCELLGCAIDDRWYLCWN